MRDQPAVEGELALWGPVPFGTIALLGCAIVVTMTSAPVAMIAILAGLEPGAPHAVSDGAALLAPSALLWSALFGLEARRRLRRVRVSWDAWGLFEWEGASVRTAIPWSAARVELKVQRDAVEWAHVFDGEGRCITVCARAADPPHWQPARACEVDALDPLAHRLRALPRGIAQRDVRDRVRPDAWWSQLRVLVPVVVLTSLLFVWLPPAWALSGALAVLALALATLPALVEVVKLARTEWEHRDLRGLWLERMEGPVVLARDEEGRDLRLDPRGWAVSDASLARRRGGLVLARLGAAAADAGPYRQGLGARAVEIAETPFDRSLRRRRLALASIELVVRLAVLTVAIRVAWAMIEWLASLT